MKTSGSAKARLISGTLRSICAIEANELERDYRRQMTAEFKRPKVDKFTGRKVMVWVCPSGNNHAFDCSKMQVLCVMQAKLLPSGIEIDGKKDQKKEEEEDDAK